MLLNRPLLVDPRMVNSTLSLKPATPDSKPLQGISRVETHLDKPIDKMSPEELFAELDLFPVPNTVPMKYSKHSAAAGTDKKVPDVQSNYVRTFKIKVNYLRRALNQLIGDGFGAMKQIETWLEATEDLPALSKVYLRYCGQTKNTPWSRHLQDICSSEATQIPCSFLSSSRRNRSAGACDCHCPVRLTTDWGARANRAQQVLQTSRVRYGS